MIGCGTIGASESATGCMEATGAMLATGATGANDGTGSAMVTGWKVGEGTGGRVGKGVWTGGDVGETPPMGSQTQSLSIRDGKKGQFSIGMRPNVPADCKVPQSTGGLGGNSKTPVGFVTCWPAPHTLHIS
jgi:hypothetical protein